MFNVLSLMPRAHYVAFMIVSKMIQLQVMRKLK